MYENRELLARALGESAARAAGQARALPNGPHHVMVLTGVVAYYTSAPGARVERARPLVAQLHRAFAPLIGPTVAFMRAWRLARRVRAGGA